MSPSEKLNGIRKHEVCFHCKILFRSFVHCKFAVVTSSDSVNFNPHNDLQKRNVNEMKNGGIEWRNSSQNGLKLPHQRQKKIYDGTGRLCRMGRVWQNTATDHNGCHNPNPEKKLTLEGSLRYARLRVYRAFKSVVVGCGFLVRCMLFRRT